jgi:hypothetical protein
VKRLVISGTIAVLVAGGAGFAFADGGPTPNGHNDFGLCTALAAQEAHNPNGPAAPIAAAVNDDFCSNDADNTPGGSTHGKSGH